MTHYGLYKIFRSLVEASPTLETFQSGPGEFFPVNPADSLYPILYLEQEQAFNRLNALKRRSVAFWVLDRTFSETEDMMAAAAQCLSKCEQMGEQLIAALASQYPDALPDPQVYNGVAVPITGSDRAMGYRFEVVLDFATEIDTCN